MNQIDLLKLNVNEHTEKKNGLTYLSWAWAWAEALKADSAASFEIQMCEGKPYTVIDDTAMVFVTVTMFGKPLTCFLPVMNGANKPITFSGRTIQTRNGPIIEKIDSFNVNTALMRCLTKCLAMHGMGLYIYAGEDLPEPEEVAEEPPKKTKTIDTPAKNDAKKRPQPTEWDNSDASRQLFADGMIKYADICTKVDDLNSYWMNNQLQLESLKQTHADLFKRVLEHFSTMKKTFTEGTANV
jgi:hypothetical protein